MQCCYDSFLCKQKTAYEMRISDWSSDVCSSDLLAEEKAATEATADESGDAEATEGGEPNANAEFGQSVADLAQTEGTTGEDVSTYARENNPGVEAGQAGDVRQAGAVGQGDDAGTDADGAEEQAPAQAAETGWPGDEHSHESSDAAPASAARRPTSPGH